MSVPKTRRTRCCASPAARRGLCKPRLFALRSRSSASGMNSICTGKTERCAA